MQVLNNLLRCQCPQIYRAGRSESDVRFRGKRAWWTTGFDVTVKDTGIGMSESFLEKIHEPFSARATVLYAVTRLGQASVIGIVNRILNALVVSWKFNLRSAEGRGFPFELQFAQTREDYGITFASTSQELEKRRGSGLT